MDNRFYKVVGKVFVNKGADAASKVADSLMNIRAPEGNYEKIGSFFKRFCRVSNIDSEISIHHRKVFISTMLHLYSPHVFHIPPDAIYMNFGFVKALSCLLGCDQGNTSKLIRQVVFEEGVYEEYRDEVTGVLESYKQKAA